MPRLPRIHGKEIISALNKVGFRVIRIKGSHYFLRHADGRSTVIPVHSSEIIGPGLMNKILKDVDLELKEFIDIIS